MSVSLQECQKEHLGRVLWANIDGVARNVLPLIAAINNDVATGVKVVAAEEWERCQQRLRAAHDLLADLEAKAGAYDPAQVVGRLREILRRESNE